MAQSALERIDGHNQKQKKRRKTAAGIIIPVMALCIAAAGIGMRQSSIPKQPVNKSDELSITEITSQNVTQESDNGNQSSIPKQPVNQPDELNKTEITSQNMTQESDNVNQSNDSANGFFQGIADNNSKPQETKKMISSYPGSTAACYAAPKKGEINMSIPLRNAIEEYGNGVLYRVVIDIFDASGQIFDKNVFSSEADRLFKLGYTCAIEEINDGNETRTLFTMHATAEQLESFTVNPDYGYMMFLYDE